MPRHEVKYPGYDQTLINFVSSQKIGTQHTYKSSFRYICKFTGMSGEQILKSKQSDRNFEWERKIIDFKQWMKTQTYGKGKNFSDHAIRTAINALRSFFDYYRTPLSLSQQEKRKLNGKAHRTTKDYMLTNDDLNKMATAGDLRDKYLTLAGKSFGLRAGDFITFTYGTFRSINLEDEAPIFLGETQTQKEGITAFPFIDADALPVIKTILQANKDKSNEERILTIDHEELSTVLQRIAKTAGINLGDKRLRFHCLRKFLIDRLSANMSESKWKQIVGKAISEEAYVSSFELKESYQRAMKLTTVYTNGNGKVTKLSEELETLKNQLSELTARLEEKDKEIAEIKQLALPMAELMNLAKKMGYLEIIARETGHPIAGINYGTQEELDKEIEGTKEANVKKPSE